MKRKTLCFISEINKKEIWSQMSLSKNNPKTSETCELLLEGIKSSIRSVDPFRQSDAKTKLEMLKRNRCKKALLWINEIYRNDPSPFVQQFAKKALDYAQSL